MVRINIESVVEGLDYDLKRALEAAVKEAIPGAEVNRNTLFRAFRRAVGRKCSTWVTVPDSCVRVD